MSHADLGQVSRVDGNILLITLYLTSTQDSENNVKTHGYACCLNMLLVLARGEFKDREVTMFSDQQWREHRDDLQHFQCTATHSSMVGWVKAYGQQYEWKGIIISSLGLLMTCQPRGRLANW